MYKKVLIKLSGEALGENGIGINYDIVADICQKIKMLKEKNVSVAIVVGGGNFWRGRNNQYLNKVTTDNVGMLATIMNSLVITDVLNKLGCSSVAISNLEINKVIEFTNVNKIKEYYENKVIVFGGGSGNPFFSTDTATALRAIELDCDLIIKLTNVDGIYTSDPKKDENAKLIENISYSDVIKNNLSVMDIESISLCSKHKIPIVITNLHGVNLIDIVDGKKIGSYIK